MANIAVLGHGVVGSGVLEVLTSHAASIAKRAKEEIHVKYILDLKEFPGLPYSDRFTKDFNVILNDPEVQIVVEVMGGLHPAYDFVKACLENGIPVGLGTDTGCPYITHYDMWRELCYFVKYCGVTPAFALYSATLLNAELAGISDITGSVEPGKAADLIVCDRDPLADLTALRSLHMVIKDGLRIQRPAVKKMPEVERELDKFL